MDAYIGTILPWAGAWAPRGWAFCQGQAMSINQNQALFAVIGTQYGGDGKTTFNLPDLRGRFPIGAGVNLNTGKLWRSGETNPRGEAMTATIGINNIPAHNHEITNTVSSSGDGTNMSLSLDIGIPVNTDNPNTAPVNVPANNNCTLAVGKTNGGQITNIYTTNAPTANATLKPFTVSKDITVPAPSITVTSSCGNTGAGGNIDVSPSYLCINYIIALLGLWPDHD